jgi:hypothetical protein
MLKLRLGSGGKWITKTINVGDNVVVCVDNSTNESLWILLGDKGMHIVKESSKYLEIVFYYLLKNDKSHAYVFSH